MFYICMQRDGYYDLAGLSTGSQYSKREWRSILLVQPFELGRWRRCGIHLVAFFSM